MTIEEAQELLTDRIRPITDTEYVSIADADGRVAAEDIYAVIDVPSWPRSAMDGYAVRSDEVKEASEDAPAILRVIGEIDAGDYWSEEETKAHIKQAAESYLENPGMDKADSAGGADGGDTSLTAVRIMTGGAVPPGFDAVIRQEDTDYGETFVSIYKGQSEGMNICPVGEECSSGTCVAGMGTLIGRVELGLMASVGVSGINVIRRPRIAILTTGSELDTPGEELKPGHIYGSISYMLASSVRKAGFDIVIGSHVADDHEAIKRELLTAAETADLVITTGGVSVGKKDLLHGVLDEIGAEKLFYNVDIQPGTPTIAAILNDKPVLSLSGNPYAALANFDIYFHTAAAALTGCAVFLPRVTEAVLDDPYDKVNHHRRLIRAFSQDGHVKLNVSNHKSSVFGNMNQCNCYIDIPGGVSVSPGDVVKIRMIE
ncbi:MAG: molybdopterin molybdotransferase MoeA [Lachnospiraceae bacterium]|nr:molybdopterin molybdotransferase MoeA [Lachnospiraceae bacterium]